MRWGDSDSSDEEAYIPSKKAQQEDGIHQTIVDDVEDVTEPALTHRPRTDCGHIRNDHQQDSYRRGGNNSNYHSNDRNKGRSNRTQQRDRGGGGRGGSGKNQTQRSGDWRAMAKSASRFSTGGG